jgi:hypothetical protein
MSLVSLSEIIVNRNGRFEQSLTKHEIGKLSLRLGGGHVFGRDLYERTVDGLAEIDINGHLADESPIEIEYTNSNNVREKCVLANTDVISIFEGKFRRKCDYAGVNNHDWFPHYNRLVYGDWPIPGVNVENISAYRESYPDIEFNQINNTSMSIKTETYKLVKIIVNLTD